MNVKVLKPNEFYFRISIEKDSKYFGLQGMMDLSNEISSLVKVLGVKESNPISNIYCWTDNHSDYMRIVSKSEIIVEMM